MRNVRTGTGTETADTHCARCELLVQVIRHTSKENAILREEVLQLRAAIEIFRELASRNTAIQDRVA